MKLFLKVSYIMNALIVALCYRGQDNYVQNEGTLKDIEIITDILVEKWGFDLEDIKILKEEKATASNFRTELNRMIDENKKCNFVYFVGHGSTLKNSNKSATWDDEENDSVLCFWDELIFDDEICKLISRFNPKTKNIFMFSQCYSGGSADFKFDMNPDGSLSKVKKVRDVKSKSILVSAVDNNQISWVWPDGTNFAKCFRKLVNEYEDITFLTLMLKLRQLCTKQNFSVSSSFKIDRHDKLFEPKHYCWMRT